MSPYGPCSDKTRRRNARCVGVVEQPFGQPGLPPTPGIRALAMVRVSRFEEDYHTKAQNSCHRALSEHASLSESPRRSKGSSNRRQARWVGNARGTLTDEEPVDIVFRGRRSRNGWGGWPDPSGILSRDQAQIVEADHVRLEGRWVGPLDCEGESMRSRGERS